MVYLTLLLPKRHDYIKKIYHLQPGFTLYYVYYLGCYSNSVYSAEKTERCAQNSSSSLFRSFVHPVRENCSEQLQSVATDYSLRPVRGGGALLEANPCGLQARREAFTLLFLFYLSSCLLKLSNTVFFFDVLYT